MAGPDARPLKILQIASSLRDWGGIERYVLYLSQGLEARGHEVTVLCPEGSPLAQRWHRCRYASVRKNAAWLSFLGLRRALGDGRWDVAHTHFSPDFGLPSLLMRSRGAKMVLTRHLALPWKPGRVVRVLGTFDRIVPVSRAAMDVQRECGIPETRMDLAPAGLPDPGRSEGPGDPRTLGFFGRFVEEKGVDRLVTALGLAVDWSARIYGSGPLEGALATAVGELKAGSRIRLMGRVDDVMPAMREVGLVAIPSVWAEAFPYSALEAMAVGRPVIANRVGGLPEQVVDGSTGVLCESVEPEEWATRLHWLSADELRRMGEAARTRYEAEFTLQAFAERMERVYLRTLS